MMCKTDFLARMMITFYIIVYKIINVFVKTKN